jgi:hypothetical protein
MEHRTARKKPLPPIAEQCDTPNSPLEAFLLIAAFPAVAAIPPAVASPYA